MASLFNYSNVNDVVNAAAQSAYRKEYLNAPDWMDKHFKLVKESSGIPGDWQTWANQRGILHLMADDRVKFLAIQKSTRMGYTKMLTGNKLRNAVQLKRNVIGYQPSNDDAEGYDKDELTPAIESSPEILKALRVSSAHKKDALNTITRKSFTDAVIHNLGGESPKNYRRRTADLVDGDEIDELPLNVGKSKNQRQGSAIRLMARAITDSPFGKQIVGSSPTVQGFSIIEKQILALKQVFQRYFPCPSCGFFQTLKFGTTDEADRFGIKWVNNNPNTAKYCCESCHTLIEYEQMIDEMDPLAHWQSNDYRIADSDGEIFTKDDSGKFTIVADPPRRCGLKMNSLFSYLLPWSELVEIFLEASSMARGGDNSDLITVTNHLFGETWKEEVYDVVEPLEFQEDHCIVYNAQVPGPVRVMTCGIDIQKDHAHIDFVGWADGETSYGIKYIRHYGDPDEIDFWDALEKLVDQEFRHELGHTMVAKLVCIDSGHKAKEVYKFCRRDAIRFIPVKGAPVKLGQKTVDFPVKRNKDRVFLTWVGGDACLDILRKRYLKEANEDRTVPSGYCFWPNGEGYDQPYFKSLLADRKIKKGRLWSWEPPEGVSNDSSDARKYAFAGIRILQDEFHFDLSVKVIKKTEKTEESDVYARIRQKARRING